MPFAVTDGIRSAVFVAFTTVALAMPFDFIGQIDPFKVFEPSHLTTVSTAFITVLLIISLFFYRPWCTLACPFGLTGGWRNIFPGFVCAGTKPSAFNVVLAIALVLPAIPSICWMVIKSKPTAIPAPLA
jgi:hypothetical protein